MASRSQASKPESYVFRRGIFITRKRPLDHTEVTGFLKKIKTEDGKPIGLAEASLRTVEAEKIITELQTNIAELKVEIEELNTCCDHHQAKHEYYNDLFDKRGTNIKKACLSIFRYQKTLLNALREIHGKVAVLSSTPEAGFTEDFESCLSHAEIRAIKHQLDHENDKDNEDAGVL